MATGVSMAKQAVHDKFESQVNTAEAKLGTLKAQAESAKANLELKAIAELLTAKQSIQQKLRELKNSDENQFDRAKADLETRIADFEKSVREIESKVKTS